MVPRILQVKYSPCKSRSNEKTRSRWKPNRKSRTKLLGLNRIYRSVLHLDTVSSRKDSVGFTSGSGHKQSYPFIKAAGCGVSSHSTIRSNFITRYCTDVTGLSTTRKRMQKARMNVVGHDIKTELNNLFSDVYVENRL